MAEPGSEAHALATHLDVSAAETGPSSGFSWTTLVFKARLQNCQISLQNFPLNCLFLSFPRSPCLKFPWWSLVPSSLLRPLHFLRSLISIKVIVSGNNIKCCSYSTLSPLRASALLLACGPTYGKQFSPLTFPSLATVLLRVQLGSACLTRAGIPAWLL